MRRRRSKAREEQRTFPRLNQLIKVCSRAPLIQDRYSTGTAAQVQYVQYVQSGTYWTGLDCTVLYLLATHSARPSIHGPAPLPGLGPCIAYRNIRDEVNVCGSLRRVELKAGPLAEDISPVFPASTLQPRSVENDRHPQLHFTFLEARSSLGVDRSSLYGSHHVARTRSASRQP